MEDNAYAAACLPELQPVFSLIATFCLKPNTEELTRAKMFLNVACISKKLSMFSLPTSKEKIIETTEYPVSNNFRVTD